VKQSVVPFFGVLKSCPLGEEHWKFSWLKNLNICPRPLFLLFSKYSARCWAQMAHACYPSYSGASTGKQIMRSYLKKTHHKKGYTKKLAISPILCQSCPDWTFLLPPPMCYSKPML
jgi:hypothetical protein